MEDHPGAMRDFGSAEEPRCYYPRYLVEYNKYGIHQGSRIEHPDYFYAPGIEGERIEYQKEELEKIITSFNKAAATDPERKDFGALMTVDRKIGEDTRFYVDISKKSRENGDREDVCHYEYEPGLKCIKEEHTINIKDKLERDGIRTISDPYFKSVPLSDRPVYGSVTGMIAKVWEQAWKYYETALERGKSFSTVAAQDSNTDKTERPKNIWNNISH